MFNAYRGLLFLLPALALGAPAMAQVTTVSIPLVTGLCTSTNSTDDECFNTVDAYIASSSVTAQISDAVFSLASVPVTELPICIRVAEAIRMLGASVVDTEQQFQIAQIASTVEACSEIPVAAIAPLGGDLASPN